MTVNRQSVPYGTCYIELGDRSAFVLLTPVAGNRVPSARFEPWGIHGEVVLGRQDLAAAVREIAELALAFSISGETTALKSLQELLGVADYKQLDATRHFKTGVIREADEWTIDTTIFLGRHKIGDEKGFVSSAELTEAEQESTLLAAIAWGRDHTQSTPR